MTLNLKPTLLFMGSPEFACDILRALHENHFQIIGVVAQPDKKAGRGMKMHSPEVALFAREHNLPLSQPDTLRDPEAVAWIADKKPDFIIVAAYGKLLPDTILKIPKIDCLNVHASLLPEYRGAAPVNHVLLDGKTETGVSIMRMVKALDAGPVYVSERLKIDQADDAMTLTKKLSKLGAEALIKIIDDILTKKIKPIEQDHARATYAPKLTRDLSPIDWKQPAQKTFCQIRALVPWPTATTLLMGKNIKIFSSKILPEKSTQPPGTIAHIAHVGWTIATGTTNLLVTDIQMEGRARMSAFDLANGLRLGAGVVLGRSYEEGNGA